MSLLPGKAIVVRRASKQFDVWLPGVVWKISKDSGGYVYTGIYDDLIATFQSGSRAKKFAAQLDQETTG